MHLGLIPCFSECSSQYVVGCYLHCIYCILLRSVRPTCLYSGISLSAENAHLASLQDYELTYPSRVDSRGNHISYDLKTAGQGPHKRDTSADDESIYFRVDVFGETFILNVTTSEQFVWSNMVVEYIGENGSRLQQPSQTGCYHTGHVFGGSAEGWTAVSSCQGLVSLKF